MNVSDGVNPYEFAEPLEPIPQPPPTKRPTGLVVISVITLLLGGMGLLASGGGVAGLFVGRMVQGQLIEQAEGNPDDKEMQSVAEMQRKTMAVTEKYFLANIICQMITFAVCLVLVTGAIMLLWNSPRARKVLIAGCLLAIVTDTGKTLLTYYVQTATFDAMGDTMPAALAADEDIPPEKAEKIESLMSTFMTAGKILAVIFLFGWFIIKAAFYLWSYFYLSRPEIRAVFRVAGCR